MKDYDYKEDEFARLERSLDNLDAQNENLEYENIYVLNGYNKAITMLENTFLTRIEKLQILSAIYNSGRFEGGDD